MNEKIEGYIAAVAKELGIEVSPKDDLFKNGVLDSMGFIMLLSYIQDEFGIEFSEEDMKPENFVNVDAIVVFWKNRID